MYLLLDTIICFFILDKSSVVYSRTNSKSSLSLHRYAFHIRGGTDSIINITTSNELSDDQDKINALEEEYIISSIVTTAEDEGLNEEGGVIIEVNDTITTSDDIISNDNIIEDTSMEETTTEIIDITNITENTMNKARDLRMEGKNHHDNGDYTQAIQKFQLAIEELSNQDTINEEEMFEELSTCNLHMALCQLKSQEYQDCIQTCNTVLQEGNDSNSSNTAVSTAIRARAYHRRAKAKYALDNNSKEALEDAKTAAFLAPDNSKTVAFYGKLMREHMLVPSANTLPSSSFFPPSNPLFGSSKSKSSTAPPIPNFESLLGNFLPTNSNNKNQDQNIVQTIFQSLSTKLKNENLQQTICTTLNTVSSSQLQSLSSLFLGFDLSSSQASNIVSIIQNIKLTPKKIQRYIYWGEKSYKGLLVLKKVNGVWREYKIFLVYGLILLWIYKCRSDLLDGII